MSIKVKSAPQPTAEFSETAHWLFAMYIPAQMEEHENAPAVPSVTH